MDRGKPAVYAKNLLDHVAVLTQYRRVTDRHTDSTTTAHTRASIASRG